MINTPTKNGCFFDVTANKYKDERYVKVAQDRPYAFDLYSIEEENGVSEIIRTHDSYNLIPFNSQVPLLKADVKIYFWARPVSELLEVCRTGPNPVSKEEFVK